MRAAVAVRAGGPGVLKIREIPVPPVGANDVLIAVEAAGVASWDAAMVFFVVLTSVLLQGPTIPLVASMLGFRDTGAKDAMVAESELPPRRESELITVIVPASSTAVGSQIVDLDLPADVSVLLVHRDGGFFVPTGATMLHAQDRVMALASKGSVGKLRGVLEA